MTFKMPEVENMQATREIALTAVLSVAYAVAILLIVPSPTGGYAHIGDFRSCVGFAIVIQSWGSCGRICCLSY